MMVENCNSCQQMKTENKSLRRAIIETNKAFVETVNEGLALKKELEELKSALVELKHIPDPPPAPLVVDPSLIIHYPKGLRPHG